MAFSANRYVTESAGWSQVEGIGVLEAYLGESGRGVMRRYADAGGA